MSVAFGLSKLSFLIPKKGQLSFSERREDLKFSGLGPVSRKPRKVFGPVKPFLDHLYLKTEKCIRSKLLV